MKDVVRLSLSIMDLFADPRPLLDSDFFFFLQKTGTLASIPIQFRQIIVI